MTSKQLKDYYDALERLKKNRPLNVPKGTKITNDSVSLEAGRSKGSIKKSRHVFSELIGLIKIAQDEQRSDMSLEQQKAARAESNLKSFKDKYDKLLEQQFSIFQENLILKRKIKKLSDKRPS